MTQILNSSWSIPSLLDFLSRKAYDTRLSQRTQLCNLGPLHARDWEPVTLMLQALWLVEMAELVQVHFTRRLRVQRSMCMQDGCKAYMDSYMTSNGSCFMVTWTIFKNHLLEVGLTTKLGDHGTPNAHNRWFVLFYHAWRPAWIRIHWTSIW